MNHASPARPDDLRRPGPRFDLVVERSGYAWWYLDAMSDDGQICLVVIGFVGSVFSPYYAWSRLQDPEHHCAVNVALSTPRGGYWAMTERGRGSISRSAEQFVLGESRLRWRPDGLDVEIDEWTAPVPRRLSGRIEVRAQGFADAVYDLDGRARHFWRPIAPCARVSAVFTAPRLVFSGPAYLDANLGTEPLADGFQRWDWSRAVIGSDATAVFYDATPRLGEARQLALAFDVSGQARAIEPPPRVALASGAWGVNRETRAEGPHGARLRRTLTDAPFYVRSRIDIGLLGAPRPAIHESLDLDRFRTWWVRTLLPFKMPRRERAVRRDDV